MKIKHILTMLAIAALTMISSLNVLAESVLSEVEPRVPDMTDDPKSLTLLFFVQHNGLDTPIEGAEIGVNKIADLSVKGGSANYHVTEPYLSLQKKKDGLDITFEGLSVSETVKLAAEFSKYAGKAEKTAVTDNTGKCTISELDNGIYLVRELSASGAADEYELFEPYIIAVPYPEKNDEGYEWKYEVLSEPKTDIIKKEPPAPSKPSNPPEPSDASTLSGISEPSASSQAPDDSTVFTGDASAVMTVLMGIFGSLFMIALVLKRNGGSEK